MIIPTVSMKKYSKVGLIVKKPQRESELPNPWLSTLAQVTGRFRRTSVHIIHKNKPKQHNPE